MSGPRHEVADVLHTVWDAVESGEIPLNTWQLRTLSAVRRCRTAALGGHIDACDDCGHVQVSYNSCRNRHCPKCQGEKKEEWIAARARELLPVPYFHVVFTLPATLNPCAMAHPREIYDTLFHAAWDTLKAFSKDKKWVGARMGMVAVLHTWGQNLSLHPHLHCIVPGGGITASGKWKRIAAKGKFLFPVRALSAKYRGVFCDRLRKTRPELPQSLFDALFAQKWVVYAKRPFRGPKQVVEYLGRYTHKIAISNHRLFHVDRQHVCFSYKDYRQEGKRKTMRLENGEFVRRFALHILPSRFVRMRHYGILSATWKRLHLEKLQRQLDCTPPPKAEKPEHRPCPSCREYALVTVMTFGPRGPPKAWKQRLRGRFDLNAIRQERTLG